MSAVLGGNISLSGMDFNPALTIAVVGLYWIIFY